MYCFVLEANKVIFKHFPSAMELSLMEPLPCGAQPKPTISVVCHPLTSGLNLERGCRCALQSWSQQKSPGTKTDWKNHRSGSSEI